MSYKSWLDEFMPVPAYKATASNLEALQHSKRKWLGLRPEALQRHEGKLYGELIKFKDYYIHIDGESCALCCKHLLDKDTCSSCPLYKVRNIACDIGLNEVISPYRFFTGNGDPEPMIDLIDRAIEKETSK